MCIRDRGCDDDQPVGVKRYADDIRRIAVSYTHLDVYKRQDQLNAILRRQSEDLQKQSEALRDQSRDLGFTDQDFAKLQAEVQKDFGISVDVENQQKRQAQDLQAVLNLSLIHI